MRTFSWRRAPNIHLLILVKAVRNQAMPFGILKNLSEMVRNNLLNPSILRQEKQTSSSKNQCLITQNVHIGETHKVKIKVLEHRPRINKLHKAKSVTIFQINKTLQYVSKVRGEQKTLTNRQKSISGIWALRLRSAKSQAEKYNLCESANKDERRTPRNFPSTRNKEDLQIALNSWFHLN